MTRRYHLAILGGGCAGLSLAKQLIQQGYTKPLVIIEPRKIYEHDRSWSFWAPDNSAIKHLVSREWRSWTFSAGERRAEHSGNALSYQQIKANDFYTDALECLTKRQNVTLWLGVRAHALVERTSHVRVETTTQSIDAEYVIDTRPRSPSQNTSKVWQVFSGGDVQMETDTFDPGSAQIMTNMVSDASGLKFTYVLPQSLRHALVQTTKFTPTQLVPDLLDREFKDDMAAMFKSNFSVTRWERGCLPMGQQPLDTAPTPRIIHAGQAHGALRPATGYGFLRIQKWAHEFAKAFSKGDYSRARRAQVTGKDTMDHIFLKAFVADPSNSARWFISIAENLSGDEFGRFISQKPSLALWSKVILSLPKTPFLFSMLGVSDVMSKRQGAQ